MQKVGILRERMGTSGTRGPVGRWWTGIGEDFSTDILTIREDTPLWVCLDLHMQNSWCRAGVDPLEAMQADQSYLPSYLPFSS